MSGDIENSGEAKILVIVQPQGANTLHGLQDTPWGQLIESVQSRLLACFQQPKRPARHAMRVVPLRALVLFTGMRIDESQHLLEGTAPQVYSLPSEK